MAWKHFQNQKQAEDNIVKLFKKHKSSLHLEGYRQKASVWGLIASEILENHMKNRKWLYQIWHDNRRHLRTRTEVSVASVSPARDSNNDDDDDDDQLYCICRQKNNPNEPYAQCSLCEDWFHPACVGYMSIEDLKAVSPWFCPSCKRKAKESTTLNVGSPNFFLKRTLFPKAPESKKTVFKTSPTQQDIAEQDNEVNAVSDDLDSPQDQTFQENTLTIKPLTAKKILSDKTTLSETSDCQNGIFSTQCSSEFSLHISKEEWSKIKPNKRQGYRVLKSGWTDLLCKKLHEVNKFCVIKFIYNRVRTTNSRKKKSVYWHAKGTCKFAGCITYVLSISKKPKKESSEVVIKVNVSGTIKHSSSQSFHRHTRQKERNMLKMEFGESKPCLLYNKKLASSDPEELLFGNFTNVKTLDILQKISSEKNLENRLSKDLFMDCLLVQKMQTEKEQHTLELSQAYIQYLGVVPFVTHMYSDSQLYILKDLQGAKKCWLYLDATGSVIKRTENISHKILYYALCILVPGKNNISIPIGELLSSDQSTPTIQHWLSCLCRDFFYVCKQKLMPQKIEIDFSWALIHATLNTFCNISINQYLQKCFAVAEGEMLCNFTIIHICSAHMIKLVSIKSNKHNITKQKREFFLHLFALLQNATNINDIKNLVAHMVYVFYANVETKNCKKYMKKLKKYIDNQGLQDLESILGISEEIKIQLDEIDGNIKKDSPFYQTFKTIIEDAKKLAEEESNQQVSSDFNASFCPPLISILESYCATTPLWSGIMLNSIKKGQTRDTNSLVENWFRIVKKVVLNDKLHRRPGDFLQQMHTFLTGRIREIGLNVFKKPLIRESNFEKKKKTQCMTPERTSETLLANNTQPDDEPLCKKEIWQKRKEKSTPKKAKYYNPPTPQKKDHALESTCPPWSGKGRLGRKKIILRNTCTIDNLLYVIHLAMDKNRWLLEELEALQARERSIKLLIEVHHCFQKKEWARGKITWLQQMERFLGRTVWDAYGSEEDFIVCRLSYLNSTISRSICTERSCPHPSILRTTSFIEVCCENFSNIQTIINAWMSDYQNECKRKQENEGLCKGIRICLGKEFKHGAPCLLFVNIMDDPTSSSPKHPPSPKTLPSTVTFEEIGYDPVAVTYNTGDHFVCFHCINNNQEWKFYDGLAEHLSPGEGVKDATPEILQSVLKPGVKPGHIVFVRKNDIVCDD